MLFMGRLEPVKQPRLAILALKQLQQSCPDLRLIYIGDGSERGALAAEATRLQLEERVHFLGALYDEVAIAPWAMEARFLIHPASLGLSVFHAFGYGLPVVTSDFEGGHPPEFEALHDSVNGLLFRHGDLDSLVACCRTLIHDPQLRERLSQNALRTVLAPNGRNVPSMVHGLVRAIRYAAEAHAAR